MQVPRDSLSQTITEDRIHFNELAVEQMAHYGVFTERSLEECDLCVLPDTWTALRPQPDAQCQ